MAAGKASYLIIWTKSSQVYSAASLETAIKTPIPKGCTADDKRIMLASYLPDEQTFAVYPLEEDQINTKLEEIRLKEEEKAANKAAKQQESDDNSSDDDDDQTDEMYTA